MQRIGFYIIGLVLVLGPIVPLKFKGATETEARLIWLGFYGVVFGAFILVLLFKYVARIIKNNNQNL